MPADKQAGFWLEPYDSSMAKGRKAAPKEITRPQLGAPREPHEIRGAALSILRWLGLDTRSVAHPLDIAWKLGRRPEAYAPRGCHGALVGSTVHVGAAGPEPKIFGVLAHELAHIVADIFGWPRPHREDEISALAAAMWITPRGIRRAVETVGYAPRELIRLFGSVPASVVLQQLAIERDAIVIARIQGRRRVYHPAHSVVPAEATRWEVEHLRAARYGAQEPFLFGGEISSFPDPAGGEGCAIVWPLEATD